ncbi:hypothetical protein [Sulfitobacter sp. S190]|uniref:hypothetical protein n=1 Tax=Sulfitobacter sp. S190 TaxID=2867022 RepID=UPI0021A7D3F6|nr:hypothetical protein [Sulfitobacter sp. S190]UWR21409.1 hypothetical protein K3756_11925 [Sulfitobacter sp. S190]
MPLIQLEARDGVLRLFGASPPAACVLRGAARRARRIIVMVHGAKYAPGDPHHCPHRKILGPRGWAAHLGADPDTLLVAFGWHARGGLRLAQVQARRDGKLLARTLRHLRAAGLLPPVRIMAHSLGASLALEALHHAPAQSVGRMLLLNAAVHRDLAHDAMLTPAGRNAELVHLRSGENLLFDLAFERMIPGAGALGRGPLCLPWTADVRIDCPRSLAALARLGYPLAAPLRRVCHWSAYTRPGVMRLNAALLNDANALPLRTLQRLDAQDAAAPLAPAGQTRIMPKAHATGKFAHDHTHRSVFLANAQRVEGVRLS